MNSFRLKVQLKLIPHHFAVITVEMWNGL